MTYGRPYDPPYVQAPPVTGTGIGWSFLDNLTQPGATVLASAGIIIAAAITYLIGVHSRRQLERHHFATHKLADHQALRGRFTTITTQLADPEPAIRTAAVSALEALADDWLDRNKPREAQACINVLCDYLRTPYESATRDADLRSLTTRNHTGDHGDYTETTHHYPPDDLDTRRAITRTIAAHLQAGHESSWSLFDYNFTGAYLHSVDFDGAVFCGEATTFDHALFSGPVTAFRGVTCRSSRTSFDNASFNSGATTFAGSQFSGRVVSFGSAVFNGNASLFVEATFDGADALFEGATFNSMMTNFRGVVFSNESTSFVAATFGRTACLFAGTVFQSNLTSFEGATFNSDKTSFERAEFRGASTSFSSVFQSETTSFKGATFSGDRTSFEGAAFIGGTVSFESPARWKNVVVDWDRLRRFESDEVAIRQPDSVFPKDWPTPPSSSPMTEPEARTMMHRIRTRLLGLLNRQ